MKKDKFKFLKGITIFVVIIILWQIVCDLKIWTRYLLPSPYEVFSAFLDLVSTGELLKHIGISIKRIFYGLFISIGIGIPLGILIGNSKRLENYTNPLLEFLRHTPPLALVPLLILWFGIGEKSKIIIIVLASVFPILLNTLSGVKGCDAKLIEVGESFNLSKRKIFFKIIIPSAIPNIILGIKLAIGYSWRAIIGAEMIAASSGLGYMILDAQALSRSEIVILGIIIIGFLGIIMEFIFDKLTKKVFKVYL